MNDRLNLINVTVEANVRSWAQRDREGTGARLSYATQTVVIATRWNYVDGKRRVLLGGLGAMGCGMMWFDFEERFTTLVGWEGAPEMQEEK